MDELDRILSEEHAISPPPGFSRRVMAAVLEEASMLAPIPFPWRYAFATLAAIAVAAVVCTFFSPFAPAWTMTSGLELARAINRIDPGVLAWASSGIFAAIALARYSFRAVGS
jgi:hypothetical protein